MFFLIVLFITALIHNLLLICIFYARYRGDMALIGKLGPLYLIALFPLTIICIVLVIVESIKPTFHIFFVLQLIYLIWELVYDFVLKVDFRSKWKLLTPYLILYYICNYGFVVMVWALNLALGIIVLILFFVQLIVNGISHNKKPAPAQ